MKLFTMMVGLLLSFNVLGQNEVPIPPEFQNPGAMISFGSMLDNLNAGNPLTTTAAMLYIGGAIDTLRMLKTICPPQNETDHDLLEKSLSTLAASYSYVMADPEKLQKNLALPASFYLFGGLRQLYPCEEKK